MRLLVGAVFIYSGFVKAVDPWGTLYKFEEYVTAMGIPMFHSLLVAGVFALCALEFCIGICALLGCYRRSTPICAAAMMAVMLPLTLWIAIADPVADCGCFGDALIISNWATFWKNVIISAAIVWLLRFNRRAVTVISPAFQWMAIIASLLFIFAISLYGYMVQPLIDFRPYEIGKPIAESSAGKNADASNDDSADEDEQFVFVYEKDGEKKEFTVDDNLPDEEDGWKFIERKELSPKSKPIKNAKKGGDDAAFRLWDNESGEDVTDKAIRHNGRQILLLMPDLKDASIAVTWNINSLYGWATKHNIDLIAVVSGTESDIADWKDLSMPEYPIYTADDTAIKEVARGNPAVVYTENGIVKWKSTLSSLNTDDFNAPGTPGDPKLFARNSSRTLFNLTAIYLAVMAVVIILSMTPRAISLIGGHRKKSGGRKGENQSPNRDDKARPEE